MTHVVLGTGPAGCWITRSLVEHGLPVRAVNRTGRRPALLPDQVELVVADLSDSDAAITASAGASSIYQALSPPYAQWAALFPQLQASAVAAARHTGALLVSIENLYMYDASAPITTSSPIAPRARKGALRARMASELETALAEGSLRVATLRSSDYYGPGVTNSALGERVFARLLAGRTPQVMGRGDVPHSFAYIEDVGRAAATLGTDARAEGRVWITPHAPANTQGDIIDLAGARAGTPARRSTVSPLMLRLAGMFDRDAREMVEMLYEFTEPFTVADQVLEDTFDITPTSIDDGIARTIAWYQKRSG